MTTITYYAFQVGRLGWKLLQEQLQDVGLEGGVEVCGSVPGVVAMAMAMAAF